MTDDALFTLRQLADELKLPESTVRYYRDSFLDHIPSVGTGRRRRYPAAAIVVLRSIARSYAAGRSRAEIIAAIQGHSGTAPAVTVAAEKPSRAVPLEDVSNVDLLAAILDGEREQRDALWQMAKEIVRLTEVLEGQDKVLNEIADKAGVLVALPPAPPQPVAALAASPPLTAAPAAPAPTPPEPSIASVFFSSPPPPAMAPKHEAPAMAEPAKPVAESEPAAEAKPAFRFAADLSDIERLRSELESERQLVERLRESKLQLEHRAADAEAELADRRTRRPSMIQRLLGNDDS